MTRYRTIWLWSMLGVLLGGLLLRAQNLEAARIDVVYVIDSTERMGDVFPNIRSFVAHHLEGLIAQGGEIKVGLVDYKDRRDAYVARPFDFVSNRGQVLNYLNGITPSGGGDDYPESVYTGLMAALQELSWDRTEGVKRMVLLLAGAPPQTVYDDEPSVEQIAEAIRALDVELVVIGCPTLNRIGERRLEKLVSAVDGQFVRLGEKANIKKEEDGRASQGGIQDAGDEGQTGLNGQHVNKLLQKLRQDVPVSGHSDPSATVTVERYPTIHAPDEVAPEEVFEVLVSLTEEQEVFEVEIKQGQTTEDGQLVLSLPDGQDAWKLKVTLSAPGFKIQGRNSAEIVLPRQGDSSPAMFTLSAKPFKKASRQSKLYATFWYEGAYLAKVVRPILIVNSNAPDHAQAQVPAPEPSMGFSGGTRRAASLDLRLRPPDLTVYILEGQNSEDPDETQMMINSPYLQITSTTFGNPAGLAEWLDVQYGKFVQASVTRGIKRKQEASVPSKDRNEALLRGFGRELYRKFAPPAFKEAFWRLKDRHGDQFQSIQIFSNNPVLPWELMRAVRADGSDEQDFLGLQFRIARWHISEQATQLDRPPQHKILGQLVVIAPEYEGQDMLSNQVQELEALATVSGYRRLPGQYTSLKTLFSGTPGGIIHFAGHGVVAPSDQGQFEYSIRLEDFDLDLLTWRGLTEQQNQNHPFFFFNACEIGQAHRVANFVDGWAPAVLETGSSGYIGGMWPLGDKGAAEFSSEFYRMLEEKLKLGPVSVADVLQETRKRFYETGDPTFLAYVYYGDPNFQFTRGSQ